MHVQYATPSEYLDAVKASALRDNVTFPVKRNGTNFFPFNDWSGYFTSRPKLKGISSTSHGALNAAEQLFALRDPKVSWLQYAPRIRSPLHFVRVLLTTRLALPNIFLLRSIRRPLRARG